MSRYRWYFVIRETKILRSSQPRENIAVHEPTKYEVVSFKFRFKSSQQVRCELTLVSFVLSDHSACADVESLANRSCWTNARDTRGKKTTRHFLALEEI